MSGEGSAVSGQGMGKIHRRKSIRLKGYDYSLPGAYFLTIVTRGRNCIFGEVVDDEIRLNELGAMVRKEWFRTSEARPNVRLDQDDFIAMPNHVHGIAWIVEGSQDRCRGAAALRPYRAFVPAARGPRVVGRDRAGFQGLYHATYQPVAWNTAHARLAAELLRTRHSWRRSACENHAIHHR